MDNLHKDAPKYSERAVGIEVKIIELEPSRGRGVKKRRVGEWFHAGAAITVCKTSEVHAELIRSMLAKTKKENGNHCSFSFQIWIHSKAKLSFVSTSQHFKHFYI